MSWISTSRAELREHPLLAVARFILVVSLCIDTGQSISYLVEIIVENFTTGLYRALFGPVWPLWALCATHVFALIAFATQRRRLTGAAFTLLIVTAAAWTDWAGGLMAMVAELPAAVAVGVLLFADRCWHRDAKLGTWWRWLAYIALPTAVLTPAAGFVASKLVDQNSISWVAVVWLTGPIVAGLLSWLTAARRTPLYVPALGIALIFLCELPTVIIQSYEMTTWATLQTPVGFDTHAIATAALNSIPVATAFLALFVPGIRGLNRALAGKNATVEPEML